MERERCETCRIDWSYQDPPIRSHFPPAISALPTHPCNPSSPPNMAQPSTCCERLVVQGGHLKDKAWMPTHVESVQATKYIELDGGDCTVCRFLGLPKDIKRPNSLSFYTHLREMRNRAVRPLALGWYQEKIDSYCQDLDSKAMSKVIVDELPESVDVQWEGIELMIRTTTTFAKPVAILAGARNLDAFVQLSEVYHNEGADGRPRGPYRRNQPEYATKARFKCIRPDRQKTKMIASCRTARCGATNKKSIAFPSRLNRSTQRPPAAASFFCESSTTSRRTAGCNF